MSTPPQEERYVTVCAECHQGEVRQHFAGDEGWGICDACGTIEGKTFEVTEEEFEEMLG